MLQRVVRESREHVKNHCDLREELGESDFHDRYASQVLSRFLLVPEFCQLLMLRAAKSLYPNWNLWGRGKKQFQN